METQTQTDFEYAEENVNKNLAIFGLRLINNYKAQIRRDLDSPRTMHGLAHFLIPFGVNIECFNKISNKDKFFSVAKEVYDKAVQSGVQIVYPPILEKNIQALTDAIKLSKAEAQILKFIVFSNYYDGAENLAWVFSRGGFNSMDISKLLSVITDEDINDVRMALHRESRLNVSGLLSITNGISSLFEKVKPLSEGFVERMMSEHKNIYAVIKGILSKANEAELRLEDYGHIQKKLDIIVPFLKKMVASGKGANILIYGKPGTGKTELAKVIAKTINARLYEIDYQDAALSPLGFYNRIRAFKLANVMFENQSDVMLMFDEAEDIFIGNEDGKNAQKHKAFMNRALESCNVPTIWLSNDVTTIDNAIIRRFDIAFELPIPPKQKRYEIIQNSSKGMLDTKTMRELSTYEHLSPAVVAKSLNVVDTIKDELKEPSESAKSIILDMLKTQGHEGNELSKATNLPNFYNPALVNTDIDLGKLAKGIESAKSARICLYGAPGTGKSAYGRWLSEYLEKPLILKKGSDLLSKWVGGTEKNIKSAFEEAFDESGILLFDEVDSFLMDRNSAQNNWEITQVNELLTQMESFGGIFLATTNLINNLDEASMRRFDAKVEFGYLKKEQALSLYLSCLKELGLRASVGAKESVKMLSHLTPGDFATVMRRSRFNKIRNADEFVARLREEVDIKKDAKGSKMGFLAS